MTLGIERTFDPSTILSSALTTYRQKAGVLANNLTNRETPGYVKQDVTIDQINLSGVSAGVQVSSIYQATDDNLTALIRDQNSLVGQYQSLDDYFKLLEIDLGDPKSQSSFAHLGKAMTDAMKSLAANPLDTGKRLDAINAIDAHVKSIVNLAKSIQSLRGVVDQDLTSTASDANTLLSQIATLNTKLFQASAATNSSSSTVIFPLIDARRQALHELSELTGITVISSTANQVTVLGKNGELLVQGNNCSTFGYTAAASVSAIATLSDLTLSGLVTPVIVTDTFKDSIHSGKFTALLTLRDQILPGIQEQLDQYTMQLRDSLNAIHNQGTSLNPPNALTGTIGAPGVVGALGNATVISGAGELRVAVIDPVTGNVAAGTTPVDITLSANTTVGALITSLNVPGSGFTASLTTAGELKITATNTSYGIGIGTFGTTPTMNAGAAVVASPLGFSHFFGLNNLLQTGVNLPGMANTGVTNLLSLRSDILRSSGQALATGALTSVVPAPAGTVAVTSRDASIMNSLALKMSTPDILFSSTSVSPQITTDLSNYSNSIIDLYGKKIAANKKILAAEQFSYDGLSMRSNEISGVDPRQTIQECIELSTSQNLIIKAMNIMIEMDRALLDILS